MTRFPRSIDEQIHQAIQKGAFDDLPGKGSPLDLRFNPHEDPAWRMAFKILRSSGHTLPWIETRRAIEAELETAIRALSQTWRWRRSALDQNRSYEMVDGEWQRALTEFRAVIASLNKRIFDYNLEVPSGQFERRQIDLDREIGKITNSSD